MMENNQDKIDPAEIIRDWALAKEEQIDSFDRELFNNALDLLNQLKYIKEERGDQEIEETELVDIELDTENNKIKINYVPVKKVSEIIEWLKKNLNMITLINLKGYDYYQNRSLKYLFEASMSVVRSLFEIEEKGEFE